jgi:hypothetical protein
MARGDGEQAVSARRFHAPDVLPLELWDVLVDGQPLYRVVEADQARSVADVVRQLREGRARRLRGGTQLPRLVVDEVVLTGGRELQGVLAALREQHLSVSIAEDPTWIAERGGRALLAGLGYASGAVLDVGQTAIKYSDSRGRRHLPRPFDRVPLELHAREPALLVHYRASVIAFIASAFTGRPAPEALVLALPCEIADDLTVSGCSYPWPAGDAQLVGDILGAVGLADRPCLVLNDAELAAAAVGLGRAPSLSTLVLTLGMGLGGAFFPARALCRRPGSAP